MFKKRIGVNESATKGKRDVSSPMSLAVCVWFCCLPLVFIVVAPFFGWKVAGTVALVMFGILVLLCFRICSTKAYKEGGENHV